MNLRDLLLAQQAELVAGLSAVRGVVENPTDLGTIAEIDWCGVFKKFLPSRYTAHKATIVDANGDTSDAIDLVVHDELQSPLLFEKNGVRYIPAESVYAVFEVKQEITKAYIEYAGAKAASARRLRRTSVAFPSAGNMQKAVVPQPIVAGVLATSSSWKDPLGAPLRRALASLPEDARLDLGCALHHGGFSATYGDDGVTVEASDEDAGLIFVLMRLFERLRPMGTVPAIDLQVWGRSVQRATGSE
jgi:hypothetical protein